LKSLLLLIMPVSMALFVLPSLMAVQGCSLLQNTTVTSSGATVDVTLTPEQRFLWAASVYQSQYDFYLDQTLRKDLPIETKIAIKKDPSLIKDDMVRKDLGEEQRKILAKKKLLLKTMHPILIAWGAYLKTGVLSPSYSDIQTLEITITSIVNDLLGEK
jgi:hypothetical protein